MLRHLSLLKSNGVSNMLPHVHLLSSLRQLSLTCAPTVQKEWDMHPVQQDLLPLLELHPAVHIGLCLVNSPEEWQSKEEPHVPDLPCFELQWMAIQQLAFLPRVRFVSLPGERIQQSPPRAKHSLWPPDQVHLQDGTLTNGVDTGLGVESDYSTCTSGWWS
jgi:hypothetical protein